MSDHPIAIRLKLFMEALGLSISQFADSCNIPRPSLSQLLSGRNKKVSSTFIESIHEHYPRLNITWLLFGEGNMYSPEVAEGAVLSGEGSVQTVGDWEDPAVYGSPLSVDAVEARSNVSSLQTSCNGNFQAAYPDAGHVDETRDLQLQVKDLQNQISLLTSSKRRVTQITVYYDDSTFETFIPQNK